MGEWMRLFDFDDEMSEGDMEYDQTDMPPERKRLEDIAQLKSSQQAKYELHKRKLRARAGPQPRRAERLPDRPVLRVPGPDRLRRAVRPRRGDAHRRGTADA
mmetsp:Transcript_27001/g.83173  ORF Transcript_27001/g.83173 Transcript_27001/m.83173 type:complete len:102 (+) Transcript_27001:592-897(+)